MEIILEEYSRLPTARRIEPLATEGRIVATMGFIQELNPGHNIDQFTFEHMLSDNEWLSNCNWIYDKSKSVEQILIVSLSCIQYISHIHINVSNISSDQSLYISYSYQVINLSISHIHIK
jgi:hypothetical protein